MAFPPSFIDELIDRSSIEDVVSQYVGLKSRGGRLWGLCPFHGEKTPSFCVTPDRQMYYCFGCGKGGGVINFIMEQENLDYPDAVRFLAGRAGLTVPEDGYYTSNAKRKARLLEANKEAARFFNANLYTSEGQEAMEYLMGKRGIKKSTITRFGLGFAQNSWDALLRELGSKGFTEDEIIDAGLALRSKEGKGCYDRFRNRVMFPIIDVAGNVVAFGGRVLDDSTPKYLNSPDTLTFNKRKNLFAINYAKKTKLPYIILTEGNMDAVMLHQAGFDCAVASCGTALTAEQANLMSKYTHEVVIAYDCDEAGTKATQKAIDILTAAELNIKVLRVTGAKDPDEFIRNNGAEAFERLINGSGNQIEYRLSVLKNKHNLLDDEGKVEYLKEAVSLVAALPNAVQREVYGARAAEAAGVSPEAVAADVQRERKARLNKEKKAQQKVDLAPADKLQPKQRELRYSNLKSANAEEHLLRLIMQEPQLIDKCGRLHKEDFSSPLLGRVYEKLLNLRQQECTLSISAIEEDFTKDEIQHIASVIQSEEPMSNSERALEDYIDIIKTENASQAAKSGAKSMDDLLAMRETLLKKKGVSG